MDGVSLRKLADWVGTTHVAVYKQIKQQMNELIDVTYLTLTYVDVSSYRGVLHLDGTYLPVKTYERRIPFIYVTDHYSRDIVTGSMAPSENSESFAKILRLLKTVRYPLRMIVIDDVRKALEMALHRQYPTCLVQLCLKHYLDRITTLVEGEMERTLVDHTDFIEDVRKLLFTRTTKRSKKKEILHLLERYGHGSPFLEKIIIDILIDRDYLFAFLLLEEAGYMYPPCTNNLQEGLNTQVKGRIRPMKQLQCFTTAERFCNGWMIRRRILPFSDCRGRFRFLNKHCSLEGVLKQEIELERVLKELGLFWRKHL